MIDGENKAPDPFRLGGTPKFCGGKKPAVNIESYSSRFVAALCLGAKMPLGIRKDLQSSPFMMPREAR